MPAGRVAVLGSANADLAIRVARLPAPGETLLAGGLQTIPGGKGANQAAAAARLGAPTEFLGRVGDDGNGGMLLAALREAGAGTAAAVEAAGEPSGTAAVFLLPGGENSIVVCGGANMSEAWEVTPAMLAELEAAAVLLLQREVPEGVNAQAAQAAKSTGSTVILDAGGADGPLSAELLAAVDVLSPNETELARITGLPTDSDGQVVAASRALLGRPGSPGVAAVVTKLGARGSIFVGDPALGAGEGAGRCDAWFQPAFPVVAVVDTTGAGDCFTAAVGARLASGATVAEAMRFASAAGALCVQTLGAMPSMPSLEATLERLAAGERASEVASPRRLSY